MLILLLATLQSTIAAPADIVVSARRHETDLEACIARACPPGEEMDIALLAAQQQFSEGRYRDAISNLRRTIRRNRDQQAGQPRHVAALHATLATVALHEGRMDIRERSVLAAGHVLSTHLGRSSQESLIARFEVMQLALSRGDVVGARRTLNTLTRDASAAGNGRIAAFASLSQASIAIALHRFGQARTYLQAAASHAPGDWTVGQAARVLEVRMSVARGDAAATDALVANLRQPGSLPPALIDEPDLATLQLLGADNDQGGQGLAWADLGFWVRPDGSTAEAEVLRSSSPRVRWTRPVIRQIAARRYVPRATDEGLFGSYRVERITYRSAWGTAINTRIPGRVGQPAFQRVDLTHLSDADEARALSDLQTGGE